MRGNETRNEEFQGKSSVMRALPHGGNPIGVCTTQVDPSRRRLTACSCPRSNEDASSVSNIFCPDFRLKYVLPQLQLTVLPTRTTASPGMQTSSNSSSSSLMPIKPLSINSRCEYRMLHAGYLKQDLKERRVAQRSEPDQYRNKARHQRATPPPRKPASRP